LVLKVAFTVASEQQRMDRSYRTLLRLITARNAAADRGVEQDAEIASLNNAPDAFKLYDVAVKYV
jgi:hypothetical protein